MLYIEFTIEESSKFYDFEKLYDHMVNVRQPGFKFEEVNPAEIDWDSLTEEEINETIKRLDDESPSEEKRYNELLPDYAQKFLESYVEFDQKRAGDFAFTPMAIFNYLEFSFEVNMDSLKMLDPKRGRVEFSTGNFPYGGMERFLLVLKAYQLIPTECFDGFTVYELNWTSEFTCETIDLPEKTEEYLGKFRG